MTKWKSREEYNAYYKQYFRDRRKVIHDIKEKSPCMDCGVSYPYYVMQFDHRENKVFTLGKILHHKLEKVLEEIAKCDIVCANCHALRTHTRKVSEW